MSLLLDKYSNFKICTSVKHQTILHDENVKCPLCINLDINKYLTNSSKELKIKYETLYSTALKFSPEILL
jgi:hypothetical protein